MSRRTKAIQSLSRLEDEAKTYSFLWDSGRPHVSLTQARHEAAAVVASCLGGKHYLVGKFDALVQDSHVGGATMRSMMGLESTSDQFIGLLRAAISLIQDADDDGNAGSQASPACDPALWADIHKLVESEQWDKVPGRVVTFVEDFYVRRAGERPSKKGLNLYGAGLFQDVLKPGDSLAIGTQASEQEGWRDLGVGLVKAIGNGHRHAIHKRDDAERFAWAVIGLGSLLVGELRVVHGEAAR